MHPWPSALCRECAVRSYQTFRRKPAKSTSLPMCDAELAVRDTWRQTQRASRPGGRFRGSDRLAQLRALQLLGHLALMSAKASRKNTRHVAANARAHERRAHAPSSTGRGRARNAPRAVPPRRRVVAQKAAARSRSLQMRRRAVPAPHQQVVVAQAPGTATGQLDRQIEHAAQLRPARRPVGVAAAEPPARRDLGRRVDAADERVHVRVEPRREEKARPRAARGTTAPCP